MTYQKFVNHTKPTVVHQNYMFDQCTHRSLPVHIYHQENSFLRLQLHMASNCFVNPQGETDTYEETRLCRRKQKQLFCGLIIQTEIGRLGLLAPYNEETTLLGVGIGKCSPLYQNKWCITINYSCTKEMMRDNIQIAS